MMGQTMCISAVATLKSIENNIKILTKEWKKKNHSKQLSAVCHWVRPSVLWPAACECFFFFFGNMDQRGKVGRERRVAVRGRRGRRGRRRAVVTAEIRATVINHVVNLGPSLREAGLRVQPNLQRSTAASILTIFQQHNRWDMNPSTTLQYSTHLLTFLKYIDCPVFHVTV